VPRLPTAPALAGWTGNSLCRAAVLRPQGGAPEALPRAPCRPADARCRGAPARPGRPRHAPPPAPGAPIRRPGPHPAQSFIETHWRV